MKSVKLGDISKPKQWKSLSKSELIKEGFPVYGANGIIGFTDEYTHLEPVIVVGCRGTIGAVHITKEKSFVTSNTMALDALDTNRIDILYLAFFLRWRGFADLITGTSQPQLIRRNIVDIDVPLPALSEQRRIAAILNKADAISDKRRKLLGMSNDMASGMYQRALSRSSNLRQELGQLVEFGTGLVNPTAQIYQDLPHIGPGNIASGESKIGSWNSVKEDGVTSGKYVFNKGDVLYSKIRPNLNKVAVAPFDGLCSADMYVLRPKKSTITTEFLELYLRSPKFLAYAESNSNRANIPKINRKEISGAPVEVPSVDVQENLSGEIRLLRQWENRVARGMARSEQLYTALQARAFNGEL